MPMIRWKPKLADIDKFLETIKVSKVFQSDFAADVYEKNGNLIIEMNLAGIDPENVDITVEDNHVRISGSREEKELDENKDYFVKEIRRGEFERTIDLPINVSAEESSAEFEDGVLKITLPKVGKKEGKKVKVKESKEKALKKFDKTAQQKIERKARS